VIFLFALLVVGKISLLFFFNVSLMCVIKYSPPKLKALPKPISVRAEVADHLPLQWRACRFAVTINEPDPFSRKTGGVAPVEQRLSVIRFRAVVSQRDRRLHVRAKYCSGFCDTLIFMGFSACNNLIRVTLFG
jgi:hypothetical protein